LVFLLEKMYKSIVSQLVLLYILINSLVGYRYFFLMKKTVYYYCISTLSKFNVVAV
jgi:hypothetical protein